MRPGVLDFEHSSVSIRKIDNGYIISESHSGPKGCSCKEFYTPTKPEIVAKTTPVEPKSTKPMTKPSPSPLSRARAHLESQK